MVVVSAGTYHLPFNRLVDWMEPWVAANPAVHVVMQHGPSRELPGAENHEILPYARLLELCSVADAIVLQGGAGGVMDMRQLQRVPIVVPRIPVNDEVVDNHQLLFTQRAAELHTIRRATTAEELWRFLDNSLTGALDNHAARAEPTPGVSNVAELLTVLPAPIDPGIRRRRLGHALAGVLGRR
jgi:UDP-N-acetylglucosamine transferase subunit ALG13